MTIGVPLRLAAALRLSVAAPELLWSLSASNRIRSGRCRSVSSAASFRSCGFDRGGAAAREEHAQNLARLARLVDNQHSGRVIQRDRPPCSNCEARSPRGDGRADSVGAEDIEYALCVSI